MQIFPYFGLQIMTPAVLGKNVHPVVVGGDVGRTDPALRRGPVRLPIALLLLEIAYRRVHFSKRNRKSEEKGEKRRDRRRKRERDEGEEQRKKKCENGVPGEERGDDFSSRSTAGRLFRFGRSSGG